MNNRIGFKFISLIVAAAFLLQGCAYTFKVDTSLDELSRTPDRVEIARENRIEILTPSSVRVYHDVSMGQKVKYEKKEVKYYYRANVEEEIGYNLIIRPLAICIAPLALVAILFGDIDFAKSRLQYAFSPNAASCFHIDYASKTTITNPSGETITKNENITHKRIPITSGDVAVYINNKHRTDLPIDSDGIAKFNFGLYPVELKDLDKVPIRFKYKDAVAVLTIPRDIYAEAIKKHSLPCELQASFELSDDQGHMPNGAIDAAEEAYIKVKIKNSGEGSAYGVVLVAESDNRFIKLPSRTMVGEIAPGESKEIKVAVRGDVNIPTDKVNLKLYAEEERGYGSNTKILTVDTRAMIPTGLEIASHRILDGRAGFAKGNSNGIVENGETFELEIFVKNNGQGEAREVTLNSSIDESGIKFIHDQASLGNIASGQTVTGKLVVAVERRYNGGVFQPKVMVEEKYGVDRINKLLNIPVRLQKPVLTLTSRTSGSGGAVIRNGDSAYIDLSVFNRAGIDAKNVSMGLSLAEAGPVIEGRTSITLGDISPNQETNPYRVKISIPRTYQGKGITLKVKLDQDEFEPVEDLTVININPSKPQLLLSWQIQSGIVNNSIQIGSAARLKAVIENRGEIPAKGVVLKLGSNDPAILAQFPGGTQEKELRTLPPHSRIEQDFVILPKKVKSAKLGEHQIELTAVQDDFLPASQKLAFKTMDSVSFAKVASQEKVAASSFASLQSPPMIWISHPNTDSTVHEDIITLQGYAHDDRGVSRVEIRLNEEVVACKQQKGIRITKKDTRGGSDSRYLFSQKLPLKTGRNKIEVIAWDTDNLEDRKSIFVTRSKVTSEVWAAIIGINNYKNQGIPDLKYAVADSRAMYEYLQNHMNISPDHIFALYDESASKTEIEKILGDILPRKARPQDTVIIYYSGHGAPDHDPSSPDGDNVSKYLLASDTDPKSMWATAVPMERIRSIFSRIPSERVVFLADTCYSGASGGKTLAMSTRASLNDNFLDRLAAGRGRIIITASGACELAREDENLGGGHGVFTYYLLEGLKGAADADGDKLITSGEAYEYVFKNVSRHTQNMQHPIKKGEEERPIILGVIK